jgi:uroporphyrinogen decarboxylase
MALNGSTFLAACRGENRNRIPVWVMRQAGRYLDEYREVRERFSFSELCHSPELIGEVVRQPVQRFGFDAAILFSDILTMLEPMGVEVTFPEGGPRICNPITSPEDVQKLKPLDAQAQLSFVLEGIREIKRVIPHTPLIGFVGSPFTLACYLIEGKGSKNFDRAKQFFHLYPQAGEDLIAFLTSNLAVYLEAQINAGAEAVQIFESWGGSLSHHDFGRLSAGPVNEVFRRLKEINVPRIYFVNNVSPYFDLVREVDCEVVGVDYRVEIATAAEELPERAIQGNLDPSVLFGPADTVVERTREIIESMPDHERFIFNLGHGIQPNTPVANVEIMVKTVHEYRG